MADARERRQNFELCPCDQHVTTAKLNWREGVGKSRESSTYCFTPEIGVEHQREHRKMSVLQGF
jgi:hypothetical protein